MRIGAGLSKGELGRRAQVSRNTIRRLESGEPAHFSTIQRLAQALSLSPDDLFD